MAKKKKAVKKKAKPKAKKAAGSKTSVLIENDIRDIINWLAVFKEEYGIADEAVAVLRQKLVDLARKASVCR
jgi:hypothetical protein